MRLKDKFLITLLKWEPFRNFALRCAKEDIERNVHMQRAKQDGAQTPDVNTQWAVRTYIDISADFRMATLISRGNFNERTATEEIADSQAIYAAFMQAAKKRNFKTEYTEELFKRAEKACASSGQTDDQVRHAFKA